MEPDSSLIVSNPKRAYSPLRYPGGKASLAGFFEKIIKYNKLNGCTYIEPYAGGAGAALSLLFLEKVDNIVINDLDRSIYSFWKSIVNNTDEFIDMVFTTPVNMDEWHRQKEINRKKDENELALGFSTFYLNRTNRSGILNGGPIGGIAQTGKWQIDARFNKSELISRIRKVGLYRNRIELTNMDGIQLMRKMKQERPNSLFYIDPPYFVKGSLLYLNYYKNNDHVSLANFLNTTDYLNWILTYDNVEAIHNLYSERKKIEFDLIYRADKRRMGKELMVLSDNLVFSSMP